MAILFDDAATEYLTVTAAPITNEPFTMACWFNTDDAANAQVLMGLGNNGTSGNWTLQAQGNVAGDPVRALKNNDANAGNVQADSTTGYSVNTWHHACGVFSSDTARDAFIDGGSKGSDTTSRTDPTPNFIGIGAGVRSTIFNPTSGSIAEAAIWNVALSDAEVALLGRGFSPLFIKPQNLILYCPLVRLNAGGVQQDGIGGLLLTETNTPATSVHPPKIIYPSWYLV